MPDTELSQPVPGPLSVAAETAGLPRLPAVSSTADTAVRASTAAVVLAVGRVTEVGSGPNFVTVTDSADQPLGAPLYPGMLCSATGLMLLLPWVSGQSWEWSSAGRGGCFHSSSRLVRCWALGP
jgi:hypothetical protein